MSQLLVRSVEYQDAWECAQLRTATLGSLVIGRPPPYPGYIEHQVSSLQADLAKKPHVHHLKVVDVDGGEIIAYAKWEMYPHGRPDLKQLKQPIDEEDKLVDEYGQLREAAHEYFGSRNGGEMGSRPHILLALLVTSSKHRRRGAGSMLLNWGINKSDETGLPCYLQASEQGARLYQKYGFEAIDTVKFDLSPVWLEWGGKDDRDDPISI